jgi:hypothetical protein
VYSRVYRCDSYVIITLPFALLLSGLTHFSPQNLQKGKQFQRNVYCVRSGNNEAFLHHKRDAVKSMYVGGVGKKGLKPQPVSIVRKKAGSDVWRNIFSPFPSRYSFSGYRHMRITISKWKCLSGEPWHLSRSKTVGIACSLLWHCCGLKAQGNVVRCQAEAKECSVLQNTNTDLRFDIHFSVHRDTVYEND